MENMKVRSIIGLVLLYIAVFMNWQWVWGILFLIWVIPDLFTGKTYFMEAIERKSNPVIYWAILFSWIWMAVYVIASSAFPQLMGQSAMSGLKSNSVGSYIEQTIAPAELKLSETAVLGSSTAAVINPKGSPTAKTTSLGKPIPTPVNASLDYKVLDQKESQYFVGISAEFNLQDAKLAEQTEQLWNYFYEHDLTQLIADILDERLFLIYSPADKDQTYTATLGFRTKSIDQIYEGLNGLEVPAANYAVFEHRGKGYEAFVSNRWEEISASDLPLANGYSMEVYKLDNAYEVEQTEIRVAIQK